MNRSAHPIVGLLLGAVALGSTAVIGETLPSQTQTPAERGKYLVNTMGCHDCHTPWKMGQNGPEPDMTRMLSGHPESVKMPPPPNHGDSLWAWSGAVTNTAFAGPWGVSFTMNLTPDPETGLGKWTEKMFLDAIRTGRHEGRGRPILPPMPVLVYNNATDADLKAIFAYLRTIPVIRNQVPQPIDPPQSPRE